MIKLLNSSFISSFSFFVLFLILLNLISNFKQIYVLSLKKITKKRKLIFKNNHGFCLYGRTNHKGKNIIKNKNNFKRKKKKLSKICFLPKKKKEVIIF